MCPWLVAPSPNDPCLSGNPCCPCSQESNSSCAMDPALHVWCTGCVLLKRHQTRHCNGILEQTCICSVKGCCALAVPCAPYNGQPTCRMLANGSAEQGQRSIERRLSLQPVDVQRLMRITLESATQHALTAIACHSAPSLLSLPSSLARWTDQINNQSPTTQSKTET